jgi:hypothetical protein
MIFFKKIQYFIKAQPLNEIFSFLISHSNNVAKLKNQIGGLIQDGDENIFYFSHNKQPF